MVPPRQADEGIGEALPITFSTSLQRQLYKTLKGVISGEQHHKGTPGKLLGSLGSRKASGPHSSMSFT